MGETTIYERPMYWASVFLLGGMVLSRLNLDNQWGLIIVIFIYILLYLRLCGLFKRREICWLTACLILGFSYYMAGDLMNRSTLEINREESEVIGEIHSRTEGIGDEAKFELQVQYLNGLQVKEVVLCRLKLDQSKVTVNELKPGTLITFKGRFAQPEIARNPGALDFRRLLYYKRIHWIVEVKSGLKITPGFSLAPSSLFYSWQLFLSNQIDQIFPPDLAPLMKGLLIGVQAAFDPELSDVYKQLGLTHVLAISGLHMVVLCSSVQWVLQLLGVSKETAVITTGVLVPMYVLIAGAMPSVVRSGLMTLIVIMGTSLKRPIDSLNVWGTALFCMLLWDPYQLWDVGFQLSFGCVLGLIILGPKVKLYLNLSVGADLQTYISVGIAAQLCSFPFSAFYFHHYSLLSFIANLIFVPLYSVLLIPFGFLALGIGIIHPGLAYLISAILDHTNRSMSIALRFISDIPWADINISEPSLWWLGAYYIALFHGLWIMKERIALWAVAFTFIVFWPFFPSLWDSGKVTITFLDVGQGDAIVIQSGRRTTLIDAGGTYTKLVQGRTGQAERKWDAGRGVIVPFLQSKGINHLDFVVATHGDLDHIGGMTSVVKRIPVSGFLRNGKKPTTAEEAELLKLVEERKIPVSSVERGWMWEDGDGVRWQVLNPSEGNRSLSDNDSSVVLLLEAFDFRILFTGDLEKEGENELLHNSLPKLQHIDVLKVGHHGSKSSTSTAWLDRLKPSVSILSVGLKNRYGHPQKETLQALERYHSRIFRTDQQGAITIEITKDSLEVKSFLQQAGR
jgi:competence protein ComEC